MKTILFLAVAGLVAFSNSAQAADLDNDYTLGCEMTLIGPMATETTDMKYSAPTKMNHGPSVSFDLGDYILQAYGSASSFQRTAVAFCSWSTLGKNSAVSITTARSRV